jgi:3',5'-cyclic AMP phosphodiesterase CpdA
MAHELSPHDQRSLLHVSDTHFGTEQAPVLAALLAWVRMHRPSGVVITGDITQRATAAQFAAARAFVDKLAALDVPLLGCLPGNHDIPLFNLWQRATAPYQRFAQAFGAAVVGPDGMGCHSDAGLLLISLNTTRRWRHERGEISAAQALAVAERLRAATPQQLRVVAVHQPIAVKQGDRGRPMPEARQVLRGADAALAQWSAAGCDLVLGGHIHLPYVMRLPGARAMWLAQAGTATSRRTRAGVPNSFGELVWRQPLPVLPALPTGPGAAAGATGVSGLLASFRDSTQHSTLPGDSGWGKYQGRDCLWRQWNFDTAQQAFVLARRGQLVLADG